MEVPLLHNDALQWTVIAVPPVAPVPVHPPPPCCPAPRNVAGGATPASSSSAPASTIVWRIHKESSKILELVELSSYQDVHRRGLHLVFEDGLSSFASVIPSQGTGKARYTVWVVTIHGVVYRVEISGAASGWRLSSNQQIDLSADIQRLLHVTTSSTSPRNHVTAFATTSHILCLGGQSGSIVCAPFGTASHPSGADIPFELRDADPGISRLWGFAFRGKSATPVRSLITRQINGSSVIFVLHEDGTLRLWDILHRSRLLNYFLPSTPEFADFDPKLMWVEEQGCATTSFQIAILCANTSDTKRETVVTSVLTVAPGDGGLRPGQLAVQNMVSILEGKVIDLKLLQSGLWILQLTMQGHELLYVDLNKEGNGQLCRMQDKVVAEQMLQTPGFEWDDLLYVINPVVGVTETLALSDVFLRRLLQPGVRHHKALQQTMQQRCRPLSDTDLASMSLDALRNHIISAVESESCGDSRARMLHEWMGFSSDYLTSWNQSSKPYGLVVDRKSNSVGLIRSSSLSVVRALSAVEHFPPGGPFTDQETFPGDWKSTDVDEQGVLEELINCTNSVAAHLGRVAMGVLYESLLRPLVHPVPALMATLARILDVGYSSARVAEETGHIGVDDVRAKEQEQHQRQRMFALRISHSLQSLQNKAGGWDKLLLVIRKYAGLLVLPVKPSDPISSHSGGLAGSLYKKLLSQSTSQISWAYFQAARNLLLLLIYVVKLRIQVGLTPSQVSLLKLHLIPQVQEAMTISVLMHWLTVTFAEVPPSEDFSSQLSSLRLDGTNSRVGSGRIGTGDLTLGELLVSAFSEANNMKSSLPEEVIPNYDKLLADSHQFINWLILGDTGGSPIAFSGRAISLSNILLQYGQYGSLENFLLTAEQFSSQQKLAEGVRTVDGLWSARLHLLGFCLLARARTGLQNYAKETRIGEAIRCFFRAASGLGEANEALQALFVGTGYQQSLPGQGAAAAWRLHYYEWVMQIFEQYKLSEGACQFAHAALEQVDEAIGVSDNLGDTNPITLKASIKGRLWANVFKFSLDLQLYGDAYCAIISNPDEESKHICLRRFIVVLCERKVTQVLCGQELPYAGLLEKVDQELLWKAENSDISAKPSPYKLLYGFHMQRHNWRRAAAYMYRYSLRIREESRSPNLQEELHGILAAINALQLVDPSNAWFELPSRACEWPAPLKRARLTAAISVSAPLEKRDQKPQRIVDLEDLEKDYALTKARMQLSLSEVKHSAIGGGATPDEVVWSLVQCGLYETAFSLLFLFWKDSLLKRELEKVMDVMARNCCHLQIQEATSGSLLTGGEPVTRLLLTSSMMENTQDSNENDGDDEIGLKLPAAGSARAAWQALQLYLEKYRNLHPRLPVIVAESIFTVDRHMELPLWLVNIFKGGKEASSLGMAGLGADPAALLRIYLDFDHLAEATNLVLEYFRAWTNLRPADVIKRKHMCAVWFPYTLLDTLQSCLSTSSDLAIREKLQDSLKCALQSHFKQVKVDSDDVMFVQK